MPLNLQQEILEAEGLLFNEKARCDLSLYQWHPYGFEPPDDEQPSLFVAEA